MANTQSEPAGRIELVETIAQYLTDAERRSLLDAITALLKSNNAVLLKMQIAPTAGGLSAASDRRMLLTLYDARFHPIATPPTPTKRDAEGTRAAQAIIDDLACRVMEAVRVAWPPYAQPGSLHCRGAHSVLAILRIGQLPRAAMLCDCPLRQRENHD